MGAGISKCPWPFDEALSHLLFSLIFLMPRFSLFQRQTKKFCQTCVSSIDWGPTFTYTILFFLFWFSQSNKHNWNTTLLCSSQCGDVIVLKRVNKLIVEIKNIKSQCYIIYIYIFFLFFFCFFWFMWIPTDLQQFLICFPLAHVAYDFWWQWQHHVHQRCPRGPAWFLVLWQNLGSVVANANPN